MLYSNLILSFHMIRSNQYNFKNLRAWDGMDYIEKLANHIKAKDQAAFNNHFKKWIVRVVACALLSDYYNKQALILIGENQNTGKSTFVDFYVPLHYQNTLLKTYQPIKIQEYY